MVRKGQYNNLICFRQLLNQYTVAICAKTETERLMFIYTNHTKLRTENYIHSFTHRVLNRHRKLKLYYNTHYKSNIRVRSHRQQPVKNRYFQFF